MIKHKPAVYLLIVIFLLVACSGKTQTSMTRATAIFTDKPLFSISNTQTTGPIIATPTRTATVQNLTETPTKIQTYQPSAAIPSSQETSIPTPTIDYSGLVDIWSMYTNTIYGFAFEYPKLYDTKAYSDCMVKQINNEAYILYIVWGYRSEFGISKNNVPSFNQYVEEWIDGMNVTSRNDQSINGQEAVTIEYRFGGLNRFGTTTLINGNENNQIFVFNFTAGGLCDLSDIGPDEYTAYKHAVETFSIFTPYP
jgi:hypothetical protein